MGQRRQYSYETELHKRLCGPLLLLTEKMRLQPLQHRSQQQQHRPGLCARSSCSSHSAIQITLPGKWRSRRLELHAIVLRHAYDCPQICLLIFSVAAQDAGMVVRTSAGYNAAARSLDLAPGVRGRVEALGKESRAKAPPNHGQALKLLHEGMALMRGHEWTPAMSLAASLLPSLDHAVWEPGQKVTLSFKRLYAANEGAPQTLP